MGFYLNKAYYTKKMMYITVATLFLAALSVSADNHGACNEDEFSITTENGEVNCYFKVLGKFTLKDAKSACVNEGAQLAEIRTEEVFNATKKYALSDFDGSSWSIQFWLDQSFRYKPTPMGTVYSDGHLIVWEKGHKLWYKGQPCMFAKREHIAVLFRPNYKGKYAGFFASSDKAKKNALCIRNSATMMER